MKRGRAGRATRPARMVLAILLAQAAAAAPASAQDPVLDSLDVLFDSLAAALLDAGPRQSVRLRPTYRRYAVGDKRLMEHALGLRYVLRESDFRFELSTAGPVRFTSGRTRIEAMTPVEARADVRVGDGDSVRLSLRTPSFPGSLGTEHVRALSTIGTSTLDLASIALGSPAVLGASIVLSRRLGGFKASVRFGGEAEPRPDVADSVYWRGVTVRGGVGLARRFAGVQIETAVEAAHSFADSLDGRNTFAGGGHLIARVNVETALGALARVVAFGSAYYYTPFGVDRPEVVPRVATVGRVYGGYFGVLLPAGDLSLMPLLGLARESSDDDHETARATFDTHGSSWTLSGSTSLAIPIGRRLQIIPEAGYAHGASSGEFFVTPTGETRPIGSSYADGLAGWYVALELAVLF